MELSFYDWCVKNSRQDILKRWNYELNNFMPSEINYKKPIHAYFNCLDNTNHLPEKFRIDHITANETKMRCKQCNSFYQWCLSNGKQEFIDTWDYNLNNDDIHVVPRGSGKKYFFKIVEGMPSIEYRLADITGPKHLSPIDKFYNSFGYYLISTYGENAIEKYWSSKNKKTPWEYDKCSGKRVWFICQEKEYHQDYESHIYHFVNGNRCPWCAGKKIHPFDSFAQYNIDRFGNDFLEKYWHKSNIVDPWAIRPFANDVKVIIQCQDVQYHNYDITAANFSCESGNCPFCTSRRVHPLDSFGARFPDVLDVWSKKNDKTPFEYSVTSHKKVWFECKDGKHNDYQRRVSDYSYKRFVECPGCVQERGESSFQKEVRSFIESMPYKVLHEYNCTIIPINPKTNYKMPLDNEVCDINGFNLIIETHGIQHYELCGWHIMQASHSGRTPEEEFQYQQWKDNFKKNYAISCGYEYIEIPYYTVTDGTYKKLIVDKIKSLKSITLQESLETAGGTW